MCQGIVRVNGKEDESLQGLDELPRVLVAASFFFFFFLFCQHLYEESHLDLLACRASNH